MKVTNDMVVQALATLLVGMLVVLLFKSAYDERKKNPGGPDPSDTKYAFALSRAAIGSAGLIFCLGYNLFWIRIFHLGWLLGAGLLVCAGISLKHLRSPRAKQEARASRIWALGAALLAAWLGAASLGMAYGARNVPLFH